MSIRKTLTDQANKYFSPKSDSRTVLANVIELIGREFEEEKNRTSLLLSGGFKSIAEAMDKYLFGPKKVRIHRLDKDLPLPFRANDTDAGYDVAAAEDVGFYPGETKLVSLGIIAEAPKGYHFKLYIRSSMALKRGFCLGNSVGIIDHSYAGKDDICKCILKYEGPADSRGEIKHGERVGQLILAKNIDIEWEEQDNNDFRKSSRSGFGSSGR